jgi:hypothetical protein
MKNHGFRGLRHLLVVFMVFTFGFCLRSLAQISWNNGNGGNWNTANNWLPQQVPGTTNTATDSLSGTYQITITAPASVESLKFSASSGVQTVSIPTTTLTLATNSSFNAFSQLSLGTGSILLTGGKLTLGGGGMITNGTFNVANGSAIDLTGGNSVTWAGQLNGIGTGQVLFNGGTITPKSNVTLAFANGLFHWGGGTFSGGVITNLGDVLIDGATPSTLIGSALFYNGGLVQQNASGGLAFNENGFSTNTFDNLASGVFQFTTGGSVFADGCCTLPDQIFINQGLVWKSGGTNTANISVFFENRNGSIQVDQGILTVNAGGANSNGTFTVASNATLDLTGGNTVSWAGQMGGSGAGQVLFGSGTINPNSSVTLDFPSNVFQWGGGTFSGGTILNIGTVTISSAASSTLAASATLNNQGLVQSTGSGGLAFNENGFGINVFNNQANGVFNFATDDSIFPDGCCNEFSQIFNNQGLIWKSAGAGTSDVSIVFNNQGGTVQVDTGTLTLNGGGTSSNGTFVVAPGATLDLTGGGTMSWAGKMSGSGGGQVLFANGTINPMLTLAFTNDLFQWGGGTFNGGTITNSGTVIMEGPAAGTLISSTTFENQGFVEATGSGGLAFNENGFGVNTFNNLADGIFDFATDDSIFPDGCCNEFSQNFNNQGLLWKSAGAGNAAVSVVFNNQSGMVQVDEGELILNGGGASSNGTFVVASGAMLDLTGGGTASWAGQMRGSGEGQVLFGSGFINPNLTLAFTNNLFRWGGGTFQGGRITNTGTVIMEGVVAGTLASGATFENEGFVAATGSGGLAFNENGFSVNTFNNHTNGVFDFATDDSIFPDGCCNEFSENFNNQGLVWKSAGLGNATISIVFNDLGGVVQVDQGTLILSGGGTSSNGTFVVASGAAIDLTGGGTASWAGQMTGSGGGGVLFGSGIINPNLTLAFTNSLFQWAGGAFQGGTITNTGQVIIAGNTASTLEGNAKFFNAGLVQVTGAGGLAFNENDFSVNTFSNLAKGTLDFTADSTLFADGCCSLSSENFYNLGLLRKTGGTNTSAVAITFANQGGSIEADSGTLSLGNNDYVQGGGNFIITIGGTNAGQSGQVALSGTATLNGPLVLKLAPGYVPPAGTMFEILSAGAVSGVFTATNLPGGFLVSYNKNSVQVTFTGYPTFQITAVENPAGLEPLTGTGTFLAGVTNTLTTTTSFGYKFVNWTENGISVGTSTQLTVVVSSDMSLVANFAATNTSHVVTVNTSPANLVTIKGGGTYGNGQTVTFTAPVTPPKSTNGYTFQYFALNGAFYTSNNTVSATYSTLDANRLNYVAVYSVPPTVTILNPTNGALFTTTDSFSFSASASSIYGIANLTLYDGTNLLTTAYGGSASVSLLGLTNGSHPLTAVAVDNNGNTATAVSHVTVNAPGTTLIDFEAMNTSGGPVEHGALVAYLARYGVSPDGVTSNTALAVQADTNIDSGSVTVASSGDNLLTQIGTNGAILYRLAFAQPYATVSWTRTELLAGTAGALAPEWRAYAYDSNNVEVATVGEKQTTSNTNLPAKVFTLSGTNITLLVFHANNNAGPLNTLPLDDLTLSTNVPGANITLSLQADASSVFTAPGSVTLDAQASEAGGLITGIQFYEDGYLISSVSGSNGSVTLSELAAGTNTFTAVAVDAQGATRSSTPLTVNIAGASGVTVINFDALDASSGAVAGAALTNYLAGYGVTLNNNTLGARVEVISAGDLSGTAQGVPSSPPNFLTQTGGSLPVKFTLRFAKPLQSFGFTRIGLTAGPAGVSHPAWSAHAFNAAGVELESVSEPLIFSTNNVPARTFQLAGNNLTRVEFDSDSQGTASFSGILLDNLVLNDNPIANPLSVSLSVPTGPFTAPADISLLANINDSIGTVESVLFYAGSQLIGANAGGSSAFVWTNVQAGTYLLTAQLTDSSGYSISSSAVRVVINPGTGSTVNLVNFDSLDASRVAVTGTPLANYLKQNGIVANNLTAGTKLAVENQALVAGGSAVLASSPPNILTQIGSDKPVQFTLEFSPLLTEFTFTRPELLANPYVTHPAWVARAYDSLGVLLSTVQQGLISSYTNVPAQSFTLRGEAGIASIRFNSESSSLATFGALLMDDCILSSASAVLPPSIVLTNPLAGQIYTAPATIWTGADAISVNPGGVVTNVNFYTNGGLAASVSREPFLIAISNVPVGSYTLTATATDNSGLSRTSPAVKILINPQTNQFGILSQPIGSVQAVGGAACFSVTATGTNSITYQWYQDGSPVAGQNQTSLCLEKLAPANSGQYTVVLQSGGLSVTSAPALLTVLYPPNITQPPLSQEALIGSNVTLNVGASGAGPLTYQWLRNGTPIGGATNFSYVITAAQPFNSGDYQVTVANMVGVTNSPVAVVSVTVTGATNLTADNFSNRISIDPLVGPVFGNNTAATSEAGEPEHDGKPGGKSIWYTWQANFTGVISLTTLGSSFDTLLAVYTNSTLSSLRLVAADDDSGGYFTSLVTFNCVQGVNYQIAVDGFRGASGTVVLGLPSGTGYRVLNPASGDSIPVIIQSPTNQVVATGATATLSVTATGAAPLSYQWFFENAPISGANSRLLVITNFLSGSVGHYYVLVANQVGSLQSEIASIQIATQSGPSAQDKFGDAIDLSQGAVAHELVEPNASGGDSRGYIVAQTFSTIGSTKEPGEPDTCDQAGGASEWYIYNTPIAGSFHVDTSGSTFNTILGVYTSASPETSFAALVEQDCGFTTNFVADGQPEINLPNVAAGTQFFITVDGYQGATGTAQLNISIGAAPTIVSQPKNRAAILGGEANFSVAAVGSTNFFYQWLFGGAMLGGQTNSTLTLSNAQNTSVGSYSVIVSNSINVVTSAPAILTVQAAPFILTEPTNQIVKIGQKAGLFASADGAAPLFFQWFANGVPLKGVTSSNLTFASASFANNGNYTLVASNSYGTVTSTVAALTVNESTSPTVAISSPANNFTSYTPQVTLTGVAGDSVAVTAVQVLVNSNSVVVTGSNHWTAVANLKPGTNVITARSYNASGLPSPLVTRTVFYVVTSTLTLRSAGTGTGKITGETNQATLIIGKRYTVTAAPSVNCLFSNWVGGAAPGPLTVQGSNASLSFLMVSNLLLQANFVTNPFPAIAGIYNGLFSPGDEITEQTSGFITANVTAASGSYSVNIRLDGGSYGFNGAFNLGGDSAVTVPRTGKLPLAVALHLNLNLAVPDDQMTGTVSASNWTSIVEAKRANAGATYAGRFTMVIPPGQGAPATSPGGYGFATITNNSAGNSSIIGFLADTAQINQSVGIAKDGSAPIYVSLYTGQGALQGWLTFENNAETPSGTLSWIKNGGAAHTLYSGGFTNLTNSVIGSLYIPPPTAPILQLTNGTLTIDDLGQGIQLVYTNVSMVSNKLSWSGEGNPTNQLTATFTSGTGTMTLNFRPTGAKANITAQGVVLQNQPSSAAAGWFLGTNQSGSFLLRQ